MASLVAAVPASAHAAEGDHVRLRFQGLDQTLLFVALGLGVLAILYGIFLARSVMSQSPGDAKMQEVGKAIRDGAVAYLRKQIATMLIFVALLAVGLGLLYMKAGPAAAVGVAVSFIAGVAGSYIAGSAGMMIAVNGNMRTAHAALSSYKRSLEIAFRSGAVAGLLTVGIGLVGASVILLVGGESATRYLVGFGFGGSLAALFMRVGGGIFTKAADVGADLVGKVEAGIPEDDPRNPAVIADNVGDNVGDCAGMAADVFESYIVLLIAAIVLGAATSAVLDPSAWMRLIVFALIVAAIGIFASIIGIATVRGNDDLESDPLVPIRRGFARTALIATALTFAAGYFLLGDQLGNRKLATASLSSSRNSFREEARYIRDLQATLARRTTDQATVDAARAERAKDLKKEASAVTAAELFADPTRVPAALRGIPQAAVDRVIAKRTEPVQPYEVTGLDIALSKEGNARGFDPDDATRVQELLNARNSDLNVQVSLEGYQRVSDLKATDIPALDFAMNARPGDPNYSPSKPFTTVRQTFGATGKDALVVAQVHVKAEIPAQPGQNGMPAMPARTIDRKLFQGPTKQSDLDTQVKQTQEQAKQQNIKATIEVLKTYPVTLYVKPSTNELALAVSDEVERPYQLQTGLSAYTYYPQKADDLNAAYDRAQKAGQPPAIPPAKEMELGVVQGTPLPWYLFPIAVFVGVLLAFAIEKLTEYYVSTHKRPTQEVAGVSSGGAAPMLIQGFAYACESSAFMVVAIILAILAPLFLFPAAIYGGYLMALYGIALVGLGLLTTTGYVLAMDTFGPISDNAQGVFEMSGHADGNPTAAKAVGRLDAAGNTTKALTKGFAIATAVVAAIALFNSFRGEAMLTELGLKLDVPEIFLGLLIGGAAPFLFSAFAINAVGRSSFQLINEVRRQFREDAGIMKGTSKPDYGRCVAIVTAAAQRELLAPGVLAIALPVAVAFGFSIGKTPTTINGVEYHLTGAQALGGFLAGCILSGQLLAVLLANSGGMWDNAKKLIEDGLHGGKGSEAHKAAVVCDTLGDPFKDTAGPALNPLIKVMNLVALLLAPAIILPLSNGVLATITLVALAALVGAIMFSKKGSFSEELQKAAKEAAGADAHFSSAAMAPPAPNVLPGDSLTTTGEPEAPRAKRRITVEDDDAV
ncbi:MAG: sodium/proton-translocating pyrophosphatase [Fimbriimonas sp.]